MTTINNNNWRTALQETVRYTKTKLKIDVVFVDSKDPKNDSLNYFSEGTVTRKPVIKLVANHSPKRKYYVLLHELGHAILCKEPDYEERFGSANKSIRTKIGLTALVEEEYEAWDRGRALAKKMGWPLDKYYEVVRSVMLTSYLEYVVLVFENAKLKKEEKLLKDKLDKEKELTNKDVTTNS